MRVSLLLMRDLAWLAVILFSILLTFVALAVTGPQGAESHGAKAPPDR